MTNTALEKSFLNLNFVSNGTHLKFTVLVHFGTQFTAGKPKILLKTKISAKTASLEIYSNVSPSSQIIHRILVKLSKKPFFGPKLSVNCPNEAVPKGITNSHKAYNRTTDIYFLDVTFQPLGFRL